MNKNIITLAIIAFSALTLGGSIKTLSAIDAFSVDEISMPTPVSLNLDGVNFSVSDKEYTSSQYCSKDNSFTFFFATTFENAFTLRMVVDSEEAFRLNHRYEIPFENYGEVTETLYEVYTNYRDRSKFYDSVGITLSNLISLVLNCKL